jgi:CheY-like chemotaxis protein
MMMRFLLLDDERVSRFTLRQIVQTVPGALIHEAENAMQAREHLAQLPAPAVCLFDVRMPGENGLELLAWVRTQPRYLAWPVLLFTGNEDDETRNQAAALQVDGYLPKPPDQDSANQVCDVATRFAEDLLPEPTFLAQRLGTGSGRLASYVQALDQQLSVLENPQNEAEWQGTLGKCIQVGKALGSAYLVNMLQRLGNAANEDRFEWLAASRLAVGGMRERLGLLAS